MKTIFFSLTVLTILLGACSENEETVEEASNEEQETTEETETREAEPKVKLVVFKLG